MGPAKSDARRAWKADRCSGQFPFGEHILCAGPALVPRHSPAEEAGARSRLRSRGCACGSCSRCQHQGSQLLCEAACGEGLYLSPPFDGQGN